jgi:hypothetical protein
VSAFWLRALVIILTALAAALSFFLGGAQTVGLDPMAALILGAILAALNVALGLLPSAVGASGASPGVREETAIRRAAAGNTPRGMR